MATRVDDVAGPLTRAAAMAGSEPTRGLQHAITSQLEHAASRRLQRRIEALPIGCKARRAYIEVDENSSSLVSSAVLMTASITMGAPFTDC